MYYLVNNYDTLTKLVRVYIVLYNNCVINFIYIFHYRFLKKVCAVKEFSYECPVKVLLKYLNCLSLKYLKY